MKKTLIAFAAIGLIGMPPIASAQETTITETFDFDDGTVQGFAAISRPDNAYTTEPTAVDEESGYSAAFPPPSGDFVIRVADEPENNFGLASAVGGLVVDRTAPDFVSAIFEAKIFVIASSSTTEGNLAMLAINDGSDTEDEAYYRFGYRNDEVYLQVFDGAGFSVLGQDAALVSEMTIPGWNTFRIEFDGSEEMVFTVNGEEADFSPLNHNQAEVDEAMQIGVLGFNITSFDPILADDLFQSVTTTEVTSAEGWQLFD